MDRGVRASLCCAVVMFSFLALMSQSKTVTISEPEVIGLADLFRQADIVASVKIVSGDAENYDIAIYKATVLQSFKGPKDGTAIYLGPYVGLRLGGEYIVFLHNGSEVIAPKSAGAAYGPIRYAKIFNEGYSAMLSSYECVFNGSGPAQQCGEAVRIYTDYIKSPKGIATFPPGPEDTAFGCRWVRKTEFVSALISLMKAPK